MDDDSDDDKYNWNGWMAVKLGRRREGGGRLRQKRDQGERNELCFF